MSMQRTSWLEEQEYRQRMQVTQPGNVIDRYLEHTDYNKIIISDLAKSNILWLSMIDKYESQLPTFINWLKTFVVNAEVYSGNLADSTRSNRIDSINALVNSIPKQIGEQKAEKQSFWDKLRL